MREIMAFQLAKVIGHRGACGHAPENTLISMSKAHELGAKWVEFDVTLAKTGEPIIIHDLTLDRTTNATGHVVEMDYQKIAALDCGSWFSKDFAGQKIPLLADLLDHVSKLNLAINIEVKPHPGFELLTTLKTLETLNSHWPSTNHPPLLSSFLATVLKTAYETNKNINRGYIIESWESDWQEVITQYECISLHVYEKILTPLWVKRIKDSGRLILAYTVNDPERALQLFDWGVDSVFTDYPDLILGVAKDFIET